MLPDRFGTERLILRPIETGDAGAIFTGYAQDPDVVRFLTFPPHRDRGDIESYIARCLATPHPHDREDDEAADQHDLHEADTAEHPVAEASEQQAADQAAHEEPAEHAAPARALRRLHGRGRHGTCGGGRPAG